MMAVLWVVGMALLPARKTSDLAAFVKSLKLALPFVILMEKSRRPSSPFFGCSISN
jgi:hypothetical protein